MSKTSKINQFNTSHLRNAEYDQFLCSVCDIFNKFKIDNDNLHPLYTELSGYIPEIKRAMAVEKKNEKIREKNEADNYRDKLHSKLFNYVKHILYDEYDPRFADAQKVMQVLQKSGNPTEIAENGESALLTALNNKLLPLHGQLTAIGALPIVEALNQINKDFIRLENEAREITAAQKLDNVLTMGAIRKLTEPVYKTIIHAINGYANLPAKIGQYAGIVTEMNVLVDKYNKLLLQRKALNQPKP